MDVRKRLAARMVELRKKRGWSQEELADQSGLHRTYISGVERSVRNPSISNVAKIAAALGCAIGALVD
jgi:transcriptional regulator with XRE-family HTH domain